MMSFSTQALSNETPSKISFHVSFSEPQAHYAEIQMEIDGIVEDYIDVKMPVWTPGSYLVREYSRHVESFNACDPSGDAIPVEKISKNTWRIHSDSKDHVVVNYRVYGFEISVRTNFIDDSHAFLSPAATFMYVDGQLNHPVEVTIHPHEHWKKISTGLEPMEGKKQTYFAEDFDILFDSPFEIGNQEVFTFEASGVLHEVAMVGGGNYDKTRLIEDFTKIVEESTRIFEVNPNKRFVFIVHHYQSGRGGLEHLNSTVLAMSRNGYTNPQLYSNFLGLVAHEYFHLWFVKRIRPIELGPFNYSEENYTTALWIMEGFTSYYDNLILRRTDLVNEREYLNLLGIDLHAVENRPGNEVIPVAVTSQDAWIRHYRPHENSINTTVSYYNKGALLAMLMDVKIIAESNGEYSLDDVLKASYEEFYIKKGRGFEEHELEALVEKVTGVSVSDIFRMAHTVESIDYNHYLNQVGYELIDYNENHRGAELGITSRQDDGKVIVTTTRRNTAAWVDGLNVNDEIIAINGERLEVAGTALDDYIRQFQIGESIQLLINRDGLIRELSITLKEESQGAWGIRRLVNADENQRHLGNQWLSLD